jgi:hypothetical protein
MKKETEASTRTRQQKTQTAALSLATISATVVLVSITHAYEFGHRAYIVGLTVISLLCGMNILYLRTRNKVFLIFYGLINAWIVIGFGLVNGFWNHAFKVFLYYLHNGSMPPFLAKLFMTPQIGNPFFEGAGIVTFVMSLCAAYYGYAFIREGR